MKYKKLLMIPITASLLLAACGNEGSSNEDGPAKIDGKQPQQTEKAKNKDSAKEQKGESKTSSAKDNNDTKDQKDQKDQKDPTKTDEQLTEKNPESGNDILAEGEKSKKFGKNNSIEKPDAKKLPKKYEDVPGGVYANYNYTDLEGREDISKYIEKSSVDHPDLIADDKKHEHVYKELEHVINDVKQYNQKYESKKAGSGVNTKQPEAMKKLANKDFYGDENNISDFSQFLNQGWKLDKSSLKVTDYGAENVWMYQINWVNKDDKKQAVTVGKFYDIINQFTVKNSMISNDGFLDIYDKSTDPKNSQNSKRI